MKIERKFVNTMKDRPLRNKQALEKMKRAALKEFGGDFIASASYIGLGTYTVIICTREN